MRYRSPIIYVGAGIIVGIALAAGALVALQKPSNEHPPLLGTTSSLRGTDFCRKYGCKYEGAEKFVEWGDLVFHFFRLLSDSTERPFGQDYLPGTARVLDFLHKSQQ
jgi:hypothetical protein